MQTKAGLTSSACGNFRGSGGEKGSERLLEWHLSGGVQGRGHQRERNQQTRPDVCRQTNSASRRRGRLTHAKKIIITRTFASELVPAFTRRHASSCTNHRIGSNVFGNKRGGNKRTNNKKPALPTSTPAVTHREVGYVAFILAITLPRAVVMPSFDWSQ